MEHDARYNIDPNFGRKHFFDSPEGCYSAQIYELERTFEKDKPHKTVTIDANLYDNLLAYFNYWCGCLSRSGIHGETADNMLCLRKLITYDLIRKEEKRLERLLYKKKLIDDKQAENDGKTDK